MEEERNEINQNKQTPSTNRFIELDVFYMIERTNFITTLQSHLNGNLNSFYLMWESLCEQFILMSFLLQRVGNGDLPKCHLSL